MRITTDLEEQVSRELIARRAAMVTELSDRTARTPAVQRETPPAARAGGDEVHISPEARATAWSRENARAQLLRAFPSPSEVVAALRALVELPVGEAPDAALKSVGELLAGLARGLPGEAPGGPQSPTATLAGAVVRLFLGEPDRGPLPPDRPLDIPAALPMAAQAGEAFPPALLSLLGGQPRPPRIRPRKSGASRGEAELDDEPDPWDGDAHGDFSDRAPGEHTSPGTPAAG